MQTYKMALVALACAAFPYGSVQAMETKRCAALAKAVVCFGVSIGTVVATSYVVVDGPHVVNPPALAAGALVAGGVAGGIEYMRIAFSAALTGNKDPVE